MSTYMCRIEKILNRFENLRVLTLKNWNGNSFSSTRGSVFTAKKDVSSENLLPKYRPRDVESDWYEWWKEQNYFKPTKDFENSFVVLLPPPNITGTLHLGHALTATIQDVIVRWRRMKGESVLWIPGIDHAGIATQVAVEKYVQQTLGLSRHKLGKEEFVKEIWKWKKRKEDVINKQLQTLGASLDWSKSIFTLDKGHSDIVAKVFMQLFNEGLIYRAKHLVNWSCSLKSTVSDIEISWIDIKKKTKIEVPGYENPVEFGVSYDIAYKLCDEDEEIIVTTTRPETILGDVAIAVHPNNLNTAKYIGKMVWHPFREEKIPIIQDDFVDSTTGTGAVKITPAHSLIDFEIGIKHNLKSIDVIDEDGCLKNVGNYSELYGIKRFVARNRIIEELKNLKLYRGKKEHSMKIPVCSRSGDIIEYILKDQWFLKCKLLAEEATKIVESEKLKIIPENFKIVWYEWLKNTKDWNLSRQLWWGHEIPMYNCLAEDKSIWVTALNVEEAAHKACKQLNMPPHNINITKDPDVLDTWFSSCLLPINLLSNLSEQKCNRIPISLMITGHDIVFFWVARMVMLTTYLTGKLPFNEVLLHGLIHDGSGKKMSKSIGNIIKPEDIIKGKELCEMQEDLKKSFQQGLISKENFQRTLDIQKKNFPQGIPECGADALRFALCTNNVQSEFINFDVGICQSSQYLGNKIWQALNYFIKVLKCYEIEYNRNLDFRFIQLNRQNLNAFDKWILSRLTATIGIVDESIRLFRFQVATITLRDFLFDEFCSLYLESTKLVLNDASQDGTNSILILYKCLETFLRLLSPFMPFLTEHLYQALPNLKGFQKFESISLSGFPNLSESSQYSDIKLEEQFREALQVLAIIRNAILTYQLPKNKCNVFLKCSKELSDLMCCDYSCIFAKLGRVKSLSYVNSCMESNIIEEVLHDQCIVYIEHDYNKETLMKLLDPTLRREASLKAKLSKIMTKRKSEKSETEKEYRKQIHCISMEINKINKFRKIIENCAS